MDERLEEYKNQLLKTYNYTRKKLYPFLKSLTDEEKEILLSDEKVINKIRNFEDDEILALIFRMSPASIQELIWQDEVCQKRLLGIRKLDIQNTKALNDSIYFSKERMRKIQLFFKDIKSPLILESIVDNIYFQVIILFSKNTPRNIFESIDCVKLYERTIASGVYALANKNHKNRWTSMLNCFFEEIKLPDDFRDIYKTTNKARYYHTIEDDTIIPMLRSKSYHLSQRGKSLYIGNDTIERMTMTELILLYNMVSENKTGISLEKDELENYFRTRVNVAILDGTIFTDEYLNLNMIGQPYRFFVFQCVKEYAQKDLEFSQQFMNILYNYLFKREYSAEERNMIDSYLKNGLLNTSKEDLSKLFNSPNDLKSVFHLRFNKTANSMNYLDGIPVSHIMKLNVKQINKIAKLLEDKTQDELSDTYSKAIRLYLVFGLDRTIAILRGDYGKVNKAFLDCVSKLDVKDVELKQNGKKYESVLNQEFINFLFTGNNICELLKSGSSFETTWFYLFNSFEEIKEACKGHITIKQAEIVLKEKMNNVKYDVEPDLYHLEDYLYEIGLGNKTKHENTEIYDEVVNIYRKQLDRKTSSIPYVSGVCSNGYRYEVMKLDDVLAYVLGYRADCCIRVLDIAHKHLLHALLCQNGRILLTYSPEGKLTSFSPLKRNGELLIANSIEAIGDKKNQDVVLAFSEGIRAIMEETRKNEEKGYLKVATIGSEAYLKPEGKAWPKNIQTPTILEKDDEVYSRTDIYHKKLDVIMMEDNFDLRKLELGKVEKEYTDPKKPIKSCKFSSEAVSIEKIDVGRVVSSVEYRNTSEENRKYFRKTSIYYMDYAFYNEDWYILVDKDGKFHSGVIKGNGEALREMQATLAVISEISQKKDMEAYVLSFKNKKSN